MRISDWSSDVCSSDLHHITVRNANGAIALHCQRLIAGAIRHLLMRVAVDLDDQLRRRAHQIRDMPANHLLAPKLITLQLPVRQTPPQALFRLGWVVAHLASAALTLFHRGGR